MARRTRRRYRRTRSRWSSNIQDVSTSINVTTAGVFSGTATLVTNPVQTSLSTSSIYTIKNIEATIQLSCGSLEEIGSFNNMQYYIMYVPEGMAIDENYNIKHPEYILNYRYIGEPENTLGSSGGAGRNLIRIRTRLARKLNTGDQIVLFVKGTSVYSSQSSKNLYISGLVRWWTKAN